MTLPELTFAYHDIDYKPAKVLGFHTIVTALQYYEEQVQPRMEMSNKLQNVRLLVLFKNIQVGTIDINKLSAEIRRHGQTAATT